MKTQSGILTHPLFLTALFLLLLNDFVLKQAFPGGFTGKLSDVAGLFVFTAFGLTVLPRLRWTVVAATALWFVYWKSPYSQPLIDFFNGLSLYSIHRMVDYTDLWALPAVPAALLLHRRHAEPVTATSPLKQVCISLLCLFAFCSTSKADRYLFMSQHVEVESSQKWRTAREKTELDGLFRQAAKQVILDPATGDYLLSDIWINDYVTFDTRLHILDKGKKREIQVKGYYVCYYPEQTTVNSRVLNRMLYEKLNMYIANQKPL